MSILPGTAAAARALEERLTFRAFRCEDIQAGTDDDLEDVDFYLDMPPAQWQEMLETIKAHGGADLSHTLNTLDLRTKGGIAVNATGDQFRADLFFRYNQSLQHFFDRSARPDTISQFGPTTWCSPHPFRTPETLRMDFRLPEPILAMAYTQRAGAHIRVEFLTSRLCPSARAILDIVASILGALLYATIAYQGFKWAWTSWEVGDYVAGLVNIPRWPSQFAVPLGGAVLCLQFLADIVRRCGELRERR